MTSSTFDYIIVGGGNAGLVVAARLVEQADVTVCVLEAGQDLSTDVNTQIPGFAMKNWTNTEVDWLFMSQPQTNAANKPIYIPRGKGLGGSSNLNLMALGRAPAHEYDAFEELGAKGWGNEEFVKYFKKSQRLAYSPEEIEFWKVVPDADIYGSGPIANTLPRFAAQYHSQLTGAFEELGLPYNTNPMSGNNIGVWASPWAIDAERTNRISSANGYYAPVKDQSNLTVITGALATRIVFSLNKGSDGLDTAEAVEYQKDGQTLRVSAKKEVILAAGSIKTPQLLELSGVGDESLLADKGIPKVIDLPGVGRNLLLSQDHFSTYIVVELKDGFDSLDVLHIPERAAQEWALFEKERKGMLSTVPLTFSFIPLSKFDENHSIRDAAASMTPGDRHPGSFKLLQKWMAQDDDRISQLEIIFCNHFIPSAAKQTPEPGKKYFSLSLNVPHPYARGSVHISSSDPLSPPTVDFSALDNPVDLAVLVDGLRFGRKLLSTKALESVVAGEAAPGPEVKSDDALKEAIRNQITTSFHPLGTAAMLPREEGGVVDPSLKVYGTKNLRIVDASIIPIQIASHPMATVYAIAEKAADIIKSAKE